MQHGSTTKKVKDVSSYAAFLRICDNATVRRERSKRRRARGKAAIAAATPTKAPHDEIVPSPHRR